MASVGRLGSAQLSSLVDFGGDLAVPAEARMFATSRLARLVASIIYDRHDLPDLKERLLSLSRSLSSVSTASRKISVFAIRLYLKENREKER